MTRIGPNSASGIKDKVVVVTGGNAGIGQAIAARFAAVGARVALLDRDESVKTSAEALGRDHDVETMGAVADVRDTASVDAAIAAVVDRFGRIDVLINNAGVVKLEPAEDTSDDTWDWTMAVNLRGVFIAGRAAGRQMLKQGSGKIINMASQAASVALDQHIAYCTSKAGVVGMTKCMALEWGPHGITANSISPTVVLTELGRTAWAGEKGEAMKQKIPSRRFAEPEEIAAAALFLASDQADMINGHDLVVDGGYTAQ